MLPVRLGTVDVLLCNVDGEVFAYADRCPHLAGRLSDGRFDGRRLTCPVHEWCFDARGGGGVNPAGASLDAYPVRLLRDTILVDLSKAVV